MSPSDAPRGNILSHNDPLADDMKQWPSETASVDRHQNKQQLPRASSQTSKRGGEKESFLKAPGIVR